MGKHPVLFFVFTAILFSLSIAGLEITRIDVRFALMIDDMTKHLPGVFPTINGVEYPDYFSPWFYCSFLTTGFGHWVNYWTLTLPAILAGSYTVFMTWKTGSLFSEKIGLYAVLFSFLAFEYTGVFVSFGIDAPVAAAGVTMLYLLERYKEKLSWKIHLSFALLLCFCLAVRGGLGLVVFGAAAGGWLLASRKWKQVFTFGLTGAAASIFGVAVLYLLIRLQGGNELWEGFLQWQITSRMADSDYFYYFTAGLLSYSPGILIFLLIVIVLNRRLITGETAGMAGFFLLPMIMLSIPGCKHLRYMTISLPAIWLISAWGVYHLPENKFTAILRKASEYLFRAAPFLIFVFWCIAVLMTFMKRYHTVAPWFQWGIGILLSALVILLFRNEKTLKTVLLFGICSMFAFYPVLVLSDSSRDFVNDVLNSPSCENIYFFMIPVDHDELKFVLHTPQERRENLHHLSVSPIPPKVIRKQQMIKKEKKSSVKDLYEKMYPARDLNDVFPKITERDIILLRSRPREKENLDHYAKMFSLKFGVIKKGILGHRRYMAVRLIKRQETGKNTRRKKIPASTPNAETGIAPK